MDTHRYHGFFRGGRSGMVCDSDDGVMNIRDGGNVKQELNNSTYLFKRDNFAELVYNTFENLHMYQQYHDVRLACQGQLFRAHKVVLAMSSPFFSKIFQEMDGNKSDIFIEGMDWQTVQRILQYLYVGKVVLFEAEIENFLDALNYFGINCAVKSQPSSSDSTNGSMSTDEERYYDDDKRNISKVFQPGFIQPTKSITLEHANTLHQLNHYREANGDYQPQPPDANKRSENPSPDSKHGTENIPGKEYSSGNGSGNEGDTRETILRFNPRFPLACDLSRSVSPPHSTSAALPPIRKRYHREILLLLDSNKECSPPEELSPKSSFSGHCTSGIGHDSSNTSGPGLNEDSNSLPSSHPYQNIPRLADARSVVPNSLLPFSTLAQDLGNGRDPEREPSFSDMYLRRRRYSTKSESPPLPNYDNSGRFTPPPSYRSAFVDEDEARRREEFRHRLVQSRMQYDLRQNPERLNIYTFAPPTNFGPPSPIRNTFPTKAPNPFGQLMLPNSRPGHGGTLCPQPKTKQIRSSQIPKCFRYTSEQVDQMVEAVSAITGNNVPCTVCQKVVKRERLRAHIHECHLLRGQKIVCPFCGLSLRSKGSYRVHLWRHRKGTLPKLKGSNDDPSVEQRIP